MTIHDSNVREKLLQLGSQNGTILQLNMQGVDTKLHIDTD